MLMSYAILYQRESRNVKNVSWAIITHLKMRRTWRDLERRSVLRVLSVKVAMTAFRVDETSWGITVYRACAQKLETGDKTPGSQ